MVLTKNVRAVRTRPCADLEKKQNMKKNIGVKHPTAKGFCRRGDATAPSQNPFPA
jgi:hypothetical protein